MTNTQAYHVLERSQRSEPQATRGREVHGNKVLQMSLQMRTRASEAKIERVMARIASGEQEPLSYRQAVRIFGGDHRHCARITSMVSERKLSPLAQTRADKLHGIVQVRGTYARFKSLFPGLKLYHYRDADGNEFIGREGTINVVTGLPVVGVFGADNRPAARHFHRANAQQPLSSVPNGLTSRGLAKLQGVPVDDFTHVVAAGAYLSLDGDNGDKMWKDVALAARHDGVPLATRVGVSTDGSPINGSIRNEATVENALDAQDWALLIPSGYVVCFRGGNNDSSFPGAAEAFNAYPGVKVGSQVIPVRGLTVSWGSPASGNTEQYKDRWARVMQVARSMGKFIVSAAGDNGSSDGTGQPTADDPSEIPNGIGAGGVHIEVSNGEITKIAVWSQGQSGSQGGGGTGGGISEHFPVMPEEDGLRLPVSALSQKPGHNANLLADIASPASGPFVAWMGQWMQIGGTSNAAPVTGAKLILIVHDTNVTDVVGFVYRLIRLGGYFVMVTETGNNGDYTASPGDVDTVPVGAGVLDFVKVRAAALAV